MRRISCLAFALLVAAACASPEAPTRAASEDAAAECILPSEASEAAPSREQVAGHYEAVFTSARKLDLWLHPNGAAGVISAGAEPGDAAQSTPVHLRGSWTLSGSFVALRYPGRCETLRFDPALSLAELGRSGTAPGLKLQDSPTSVSLFGGTTLWRSKNLHASPETK